MRYRLTSWFSTTAGAVALEGDTATHACKVPISTPITGKVLVESVAPTVSATSPFSSSDDVAGVVAAIDQFEE